MSGLDLQALLGGAGAGGGHSQGPPPGMPPSIPNPNYQGSPGPSQGPSQGSEDGPIRILQQMISDAKQYMNSEPDQEDVATMAKVLQTLQTYLAKDQRDREAAMGNPAVARQLRKLGG